MVNLSQNQTKILESIKWEIKSKGYPPSVREICGITGIKSTSTVHFHMNKLEKLGLIKRDPTKPRAIEILEEENFVPGLNQEIIELPIIEFLKDELEIKEHISETIKLPSSLVLGKDNFIHRVMDNKLIEIGVFKNDYIIVDRANRVDNGKLVIGISNNEVVLGKYFKNKDNTVLQFANSFYDPLILESNEFKVVGQIKGYFGIIK
ncbi:transcriptional repressor LexA [Paraclostridium sordellii]|uniref:transcriptional repressor LexA n=1 Tax=Paraclostridium sordellii TaxID=1505 RepID=UPI000E4DAF6A|nr:transcriptional repressor LexA [Paeniclostridium sordellii]RGX10550.1 repressor LexA [Paeniclostridium sordellii]